MHPDDGEDRPTEPADHSATQQFPVAETTDEIDPRAEAIAEERAPSRADKVPVILSVDLPEFQRALVAYGVLGADGLRAYLEKFPQGHRPSTALGLARCLVGDRVLTRYQASAILQGKAKVLAIGLYLVLDRLGSGGMGIVFKARHRDSGELVALKLLPPSASKQDHSVARFRREAKLMAQLNHPNIVSSREIGEHNGVHYLVMDHVEGCDLQQIIKDEGPLDVSRAVDAVIQAARGLAAAHQRGIIHRDIKPANLIVDAQGTVRVLDLGLARITRPDESTGSGSGEADTSLTHQGMIMGTADYLPPEQSTNSKLADHRADVYSLGCTLHFLLTGRPPYVGETIMERVIAHHQKTVPSLRESRPDVSRGLDSAFRRMLAKEPGLRHQSMDEVINALENSNGEGSRSLQSPSDAAEGRSSTPWANPMTGRVAADRRPEESDLSGYEILPDSRSELWSPLVASSLESAPPMAVASISGPAQAQAPRKPAPLGPSIPDERRWLAIAGLILLGLAVVGFVIRELVNMNWKNAP